MLPASTTSAIYSMSHKDVSDLKSEVPEFKFKHTIFKKYSQKLFRNIFDVYPCLHFKLEVCGMTKILYHSTKVHYSSKVCFFVLYKCISLLSKGALN